MDLKECIVGLAVFSLIVLDTELDYYMDMKDIVTFINEGLENIRLSDTDKKRLLMLDKEYGDIVDTFRHDRNDKDVLNMDEEFDKFMAARNRGMKYFPHIKLQPHKFDTDGLLGRVERLIAEFQRFDCFLSKYYLELLEPMVYKIKHVLEPEKYHSWYVTYQAQKPSYENYIAAERMLLENPYEKIDDSDRNIDGKTAAKMIQDHIDKLGYGWKVKLNDNMIPRMNVDTNKTMNVKTSAKFSKTDIEGLKAHEVEGHIGRRYYGLKTGLYLFLYGLLWRNTLDEGLAIWNSLNKVSKVKPNVKFNIAIKTIICYYLNDKDFCELFDMCRELDSNIPDKTLFSTLVRFKREIQDCSLIGGNGDDQSYFCGYQIVKDMTDAERDDILKYNIGPGQIHELPKIKRFLEVNKFEPLI